MSAKKRMGGGAEETRVMTDGSPLKHIVCFAFPLMLGNICQQIYTLTDTAVVGRVLGVAALAALGACDLLVWMTGSAIQAFTEGFSIRMAACFGAGERERLHHTAATAARLSAIAAALLCALLQIASPAILHLMHVRAEVYPFALLYLRIIFAGIPFIMLYNFFFAILRALGNSRAPLRTMLLSASLNILLDLVFVALFNWGIGGAAAATVIAQAAAALYSFGCVRKLVPEDTSALRYNGDLVGNMLKLSIPMACQLLISATGGLVVQTVINANEVTFIAGYTATYKLYGLLEVAAISYGYAVTTYTGQNLGAGRLDRIRKGWGISEAVALATSLGFAAVIFTLGTPVVGLFISGTEAEIAASVAIGVRFLRIMGVGLPMLYTVHLSKAVVQGLGYAGLATANSVVELLTRVLTVTVFAKTLGQNCVFYAEPFAWSAGAIVLSCSAVFYLVRLGKAEREAYNGGSL